MKHITTIIGLCLTSVLYGQVGIGTTTPASTFDVTGQPANTTTPDGIVIPRLTAPELTAKNSAYLAAQNGTMVYITSGTGSAGKTAAITGAGFYYYDATSSAWKAVDAPVTNIYNSDGSLSGTRTVNTAGNTVSFLGGGGIGVGATPSAGQKFYAEGDVNSGVGGFTVKNINAGNNAWSGMYIQNDTSSSLEMFLNSSTRLAAQDGGANTATIRNAAGDLRLLSSDPLGGGIFVQKTTGYVGVGPLVTPVASTTLDVSGVPANVNKADGILVPRLTAAQLTAKNAVYLAAQNGAMVYVTSGTGSAGKTVNVTGAGFYFYDSVSSAWKPLGGTNIYNSNGTLTANRVVTTGANTLAFQNGTSQTLLTHGNVNAGLNISSTDISTFSLGTSTFGGKTFTAELDANNNQASLYANGTNRLFIGTKSPGSPIQFQLNNENVMSLLDNGNVSVGAVTPEVSLDVFAYPFITNKPDGVSVPRLLASQLQAKDGAYGSPQNSTVVYITAGVGGSTKTANITAPGFYYYDSVAALWKPVNLTANNGLTATGNNLQLGGNLTQATTINNNGFGFRIVGPNVTSDFSTVGPIFNSTVTGDYNIRLRHNNATRIAMLADTGTGGAALNPLVSATDPSIIFPRADGTSINPAGTGSSTRGLVIGPFTVENSGIKILENGNVGIGTGAPTSILHVVGRTSNPLVAQLNSPNTTATAMSIVNSSTGGRFYAISSTGPSSPIGAGFFTISDETASLNRLTINSAGNVGIGTSTQNARLSVVGDANKSSGGTAWSVFSDARVKKDVQDYHGGLKEILAIRPVTFKYNGKGVFPTDGKTYVGVIAQEIEKILPMTVTKTDAGGIKDLRQYNDSELTYTLINAIKEQQQIIEEQNKKIEMLQKDVEILKSK